MSDTPNQALLNLAKAIEALAGTDFGDSSHNNRTSNYELIAENGRLACQTVGIEAQKAIDSIVVHMANNLPIEIDILETEDALTTACGDWVLAALPTGEEVYEKLSA